MALEKILPGDKNEPDYYRRFREIILDLKAENLVRMMDRDDIALVFIPSVYVVHKEWRERVFCVIKKEEQVESETVAVAVLVDRGKMYDADVRGKMAKLVGSLGRLLAEIEEKGLSLEKMTDSARIDELISKSSFNSL